MCAALGLALAGSDAHATGGAASCRSETFDAEGDVDFVIDGDTVTLSNGEHLRLIGIDTPEMGRNGNMAQPGTEQARDFLNSLIGRYDGTVRMIYGEEQRDPHGRRLAHLFFRDGTNIQARLLADGLAVPLTIPPNLRFIECYRRQATPARTAGRGLWSLAAYRTIPVEQLEPGTRGYRVVRGLVTRVGQSSSSVWIDLGTAFALRIVRGDLAYFKDIDLPGLAGRVLEAQGIIYYRNSQLRMRIRHPLDLIFVDNPTGTR
ncbi:MAG: thermonuclease family protein [Gammaproteobacteria bacterium]